MIRRMPAGERFDVVIVGARCAGAPLAALLARRGRKVAVVEQATFPRNTLSSHLMQGDALAFLDRLGVTPRVKATGAPFITSTDGRFENVYFSADYPLRDGDPGGAASIRRHLLDPILADAAAEAGADLRMATKVVGLVEEDGRVAGVRALGRDGVEHELRGTLVVGADGRGSTVAAAVGARTYNVTPSQR